MTIFAAVFAVFILLVTLLVVPGSPIRRWSAIPKLQPGQGKKLLREAFVVEPDLEFELGLQREVRKPKGSRRFTPRSSDGGRHRAGDAALAGTIAAGEVRPDDVRPRLMRLIARD